MIKTYIVDAFTGEPFKGNPAGVCLLDTTFSDDMMLSIAGELGLSETAFVQRMDERQYSIRYFSPKMEIPLCGHATLAAAKVLFDESTRSEITFTNIEQNCLSVKRKQHHFEMDFPVYETKPAKASEAMLHALGLKEIKNCVYNEETKILLLEIGSTHDLKALQPNYPTLEQSHQGIHGVLVTARSIDDEYDFHSRYFWPWSGTNEDPVTGGTHTFLAKYWSERFRKTVLRSFQSSSRTGFMEVELTPDHRVLIRGQAVIVFSGTLNV